MRLSSILLYLLCAFSLTSCIDIEEEIWIEKDGSGRSEYTIDFSRMQDLLGDEAESSLDKIGRDSEVAAVDSVKGKISELLSSGELDTIINFTSLLEKDGRTFPMLLDSIRQEPGLTEAQASFIDETAEMLARMQLRIRISKEAGILRLTGMQSFTDVEERFSVGHLLGRIRELSGKENSVFPSDSLTAKLGPAQAVAELSKGSGLASINRRTFHYQKAGMNWSAFSKDKEDQFLFKMFLQTGSHKMTIHFPGKVKKVASNVSTKQLDKRTVQLRRPLRDLFNPGKSVDLEVQFKGLRRR